jgi:hypothetical protein
VISRLDPIFLSAPRRAERGELFGRDRVVDAVSTLSCLFPISLFPDAALGLHRQHEVGGALKSDP